MLRNLRKLFRLLGFRQAIVFAIHKALKTPRVTIHVAGFPTPLLCRTNFSDIRVLWEAFGARGVDIPLADPPRLIIDAGANVGYTTAFFAQRYPQAQIIAVEPDPANCEMLRENCRAYANVRLIEAGVWPVNASLMIDNPTANSWEFQVREVPPGTEGSFRAVTVMEILSQSGRSEIDLLKLDIEGTEERLFSEGAVKWLERVRVILVEIHGDQCAAAVRRAVGDDFSQRIHGEKWVLTRRAAEPAAT